MRKKLGRARNMTSEFSKALGADGPTADRAGKMDLYDRSLLLGI